LYLEKPESFFDVSINRERGELHFCQGLGNSDDGLQLTDGDGDGEALLGVVLDGLGAAAHQHVLVLQLLAGFLKKLQHLQQWQHLKHSSYKFNFSNK
jgi:hypothetical protein